MMQAESFSNYQTWLEAQMECAKGVRKRKWVIFWQTEGIVLAVCLVITLIGLVMGAVSDTEAGMIAVALVILLFPLATLITLLVMLPGFFKGRYARKIDRALQRHGITGARREQFAREQLAAQRDPTAYVSFLMTGSQKHMPARFALGEHYACFTGGAGFGPYIIGLDKVEAVRVSSHAMDVPAITRVFCLVVSMNQSWTLYRICFLGQGGEQDSLQFSEPESCEKVLNVLRQRFPEVTG